MKSVHVRGSCLDSLISEDAARERSLVPLTATSLQVTFSCAGLDADT